MGGGALLYSPMQVGAGSVLGMDQTVSGAGGVPERPTLDGLEARWGGRWEADGVYSFDRSRERSEVFSIDTPPPTVSGSLHVGHVFSYTQTDCVARYQRMRGREVFYPMGWDDNGLPTERRVQNHFGVRCDPSVPYDEDFEPPTGEVDEPVAVSRRNFIDLCLRLTAGDEEAFEDLYRRLGVSVDWSLNYTTIDERHRPLTGTTVRTPLFGVEIPVRTHPLADPAKGTGIAMVCTFGDTAGQCEAFTSDRSSLAVFKYEIENGGGDEQFILPETISKEPLGPAVLDGDTEWAQVVQWAVMATIQAWDFGLDSTNIASATGTNPALGRFLGEEDFDPGLGLPSDFAVQVVSQVGNYEEIYRQHLEPLGLPLDGSVNDLWTNGGLLYVPPYR